MFAKARTRTVGQETKQLLPRGRKLVCLTAALAIAVVVAALCSGNWVVKLWYTGRLESEDELTRETALSQLASLTDTDGWETVDCKRFSFRLPAGYKKVDVQPTDSYVEEWRGGELQIVTFDYGEYSSTLEEFKSLERFIQWTESIGGHSAKVVAGWDKDGGYYTEGAKHIVAATWRNVRPGVHLTLGATAPTVEEQPTLLGILRTVRFRP